MLNCINTKFQNSTILSASDAATNSSTLVTGAKPSPLSKCISVHGPHGPTVPTSQKLSSLPNLNILFGSISVLEVHISYASSSSKYIVTYNFSLGSFNTSVTNSHDHGIISFLK